MEGTRLQKIERLLQKELGDIFQKQTQAMHGVLVSVKAIRANTKAIRYDLGQRVRLQLRKIPELSFFIDDSLDYIEHIDSLLNK